MNALNRSWADDSSEVTRPVDVLALSGELGANDDDVWPVELFLEDAWDDTSPDLSFFLVGGPPSVVRIQQGLGVLTQAQGVVKRIEEDRVLLGTPGSRSHEISLGYRLPASLDLRPLVGRRVRVMLEEEPPSGGRTGQTLTIRTADDRVWLVARCGATQDVVHSLGGAAVRATLSSDEDGPLVVALKDDLHLVAPGGDMRMSVGVSRYVVELVSRDDSGCAAYFIADDLLWH
jgi:hypothetical protein